MITQHPIEKESFRIIRAELGEHNLSPNELTVAVRVIHASADFDFLHLLRFSPDAVTAGIRALQQGCAIVTDVRMVAVGISQMLLDKLGGRKICDISNPEVVEMARAAGTTRSTIAMRYNAEKIHGGIVAIGNAPTALLEVIRLVREEAIRPALVVGVPVGFVNAAESKAELQTLNVPYITVTGRKGGSTIAAAIMNALLRLTLNIEQ